MFRPCLIAFALLLVPLLGAAEEMRLHRHLRARRLVSDGLEPELVDREASRQFGNEFVGAVDFAQGFYNAARIDGKGARLLVGVDEIQDQGLDVAIKDNADEFALAIDGRTPGVAADNIGG